MAKNSTANSGPVYREIRPVKLDFSTTNFKAKVTGWRLSIEKKANTLFPAVCDCARGIAGISAASAATVDSEYQDPQILARANLESENEEDEHHGDSGVDKEDHDNGISSGVDDSEDEADDEKCGGASDSQASDNGSTTVMMATLITMAKLRKTTQKAVISPRSAQALAFKLSKLLFKLHLAAAA